MCSVHSLSGVKSRRDIQQEFILWIIDQNAFVDITLFMQLQKDCCGTFHNPRYIISKAAAMGIFITRSQMFGGKQSETLIKPRHQGHESGVGGVLVAKTLINDQTYYKKEQFVFWCGCHTLPKKKYLKECVNSVHGNVGAIFYSYIFTLHTFVMKWNTVIISYERWFLSCSTVQPIVVSFFDGNN